MHLLDRVNRDEFSPYSEECASLRLINFTCGPNQDVEQEYEVINDKTKAV